MNSSLKTILGSHHEYLTLDRELLIREVSLGVYHYADSTEDLKLGKDVRLAFPELTGIEYILLDILEGRRLSFELEGIARSLDRDYPELQVYFDLYVSRYQELNENILILFFEDATERMVVQQALAQRANEASLLVNSLTTSQNYIERIIRYMGDALLVTNSLGIMKTVNKNATNLFGYSQEELINSHISMIVNNEVFLHQLNELLPKFYNEIFSHIELSCSTKTGQNITVAFSCSVIETEIKGGKNIVYIGRDITTRKQIEFDMIKELEWEKQRRVEQSKMLSRVEGELRHKLTSILSDVKLWESHAKTGDEEQKSEESNRIKSAVSQMNQLLDSIQEFSQNGGRQANG